MLHNEKDTFEQLVLRTSDYLGVKAEIVEKDYDTIYRCLRYSLCVRKELRPRH